jgi:hypothetical protein
MRRKKKMAVQVESLADLLYHAVIIGIAAMLARILWIFIGGR